MERACALRSRPVNNSAKGSGWAAVGGAAPVRLTAGDIVDDFGWRIGTVARLTVFALIYAVVVAATRPTVAPLADGWRLNRIVAWTIGVCVVSVLVLSIVFRDQLFV